MLSCYRDQVRLAHNYLKDVLQYNFPELRARAAAAEAEARAQQVLAAGALVISHHLECYTAELPLLYDHTNICHDQT